MRLFINRSGSLSRVQYQPFDYIDLVHSFDHESHNQLDAELLVRHLDDALRRQVLAIRKDAYLRGYRDGRARRAQDLPRYDNINLDAEERRGPNNWPTRRVLG